jgi:hypothetical protein
VKREAVVAIALRQGVGAELATAIGERLDPQAKAAARLAVTAYAALLAYDPLDGELARTAAAVRDAGEASQLPAESWEPVVDQLSRRPEFGPVKDAVFEMRRNVAKHLGVDGLP